MPRPMRGLFLTAAAAIAVLFAVIAAPASAQPADVTHQYILGPGDQIRLTVFGESDLSGEFKVGDDGMVSLPLIGQIAAKGLTPAALEQTISDKLTPDYVKNPNVNVEVMSYRPFFIIGEVNKPGSYPYQSGMTALEAVALAGGFTYRAKTEQVLIKRSVGTASGEDLQPIETTVMPGDVIKVRERYF
ncbi:polysaccharide biosynthesis/export family protein [Emcibacter sp. SYSU 3D8]|uniref:polysaccharide biosynthesis/export family protein n=1 Tax=Emcibacter sp. SYSU 3D8 TaxID=3133969 RepID=UPI0031FF3D74